MLFRSTDGRWAKLDEEPDDDEQPLGKHTQRVVPYVEDRCNALLVEPAQPLDVATMASLAPALARAIAQEYLLEEDEIDVQPMPGTDTERRYLLFTESAEGGAGVLRQLVDDAGALSRVAAAALELCHYDPQTGADRRRAPNAREDCEAACYDCLMSYRNQRDHHLLDRSLVQPLLRALTAATVNASPGPMPRGEHLRRLLALCESDLERKWLHAVNDRLLRLPDAAQEFVAEAGSRPDFVYHHHYVAVFVDGPHHRYPEVKARDDAADAHLRALGYTTLRFGDDPDVWPELFARYAWLFGEGADTPGSKGHLA